MTFSKPTADELQTQIQYRLIEELAASEERYRRLVENLNEIVFEIDKRGHLTFLNRVWTKTLGYELDAAFDRPLGDFVHLEDRKIGHALIDRILQQHIPVKAELRFLHQQGHIVWLQISARPDGKGGASGVLMDITERKLATAQLQYTAYHDALTGLPNRLAFVEYLEQAIARVEDNPDYIFAVLFLDLDGFKLINDSLGHLAGDRLLCEVADRLQECVRKADIVARFGGDEFNILLDDITDTHDATHLAYRIDQVLSHPFNIEGHSVFMSTSIGIVLSTIGEIKPDLFLRDADIALYQAKLKGKATYEVFDTQMHEEVVERLQLETDLRQGLEREEFEVYYQPIFGIDNYHLKGFEALVRWHHPKQGFICPDQFIPIAEETGLILNLGGWVLHQACSQMRRWQECDRDNKNLTISVNLSSKQFLQPDLIECIDRTLQQTGLERQYLNLEITESTIMNNAEATRFKLKQLKASGVKLSVDDFGTGYSSLSYLHRFPLNTLKIDRSFVNHLNAKGENTEIVEAIIILARKLGMDVVAEGVETEVQLEQLRVLGCEQFQGYLFSYPLSVEKVENFLQARSKQLLVNPSAKRSRHHSYPLSVISAL